MATREELRIAEQLIGFLNNCQRDLRSNAQSYLDEIARVPRRVATAQLGAIVNADGRAVALLMQRFTDFFADATRRTKAVNGIGFYGMTQAQVVADKNAIKATADAQAAAPVSTDAEITAAANATLAATAAMDLLF